MGGSLIESCYVRNVRALHAILIQQILGSIIMRFTLLALFFVLTIHPLAISAGFEQGKDTTITTFLYEPIDIAHRRAVRTFYFPDSTLQYQKIVMQYTINCPSSGCDPWDRVSTITVTQKDSIGEELYEIARITTPYGQGGTWAVDVSDYRSLLRDSVTLANYIQTSIGGGQGFLVTISFQFIAGTPDLEPYRVENLWAGLLEYGNPDKPLERLLKPLTLKPDRNADFAKVRIVATGHGEGNTDGAATWSKRRHDVVIGGTTFSHLLWRDDCSQTALSSQQGPWQRPRAGYCPGTVVRPWDNDISGLISANNTFTADYNIEPYENRCRPGVTPCPCPSCNYDDVTHDMPFYWIESQIIYYRIPSNLQKLPIEIAAGNSAGVLLLRPSFTTPVDITISITNLSGEILLLQKGQQVTNQLFPLDMSSTPGSYLLKVETSSGEIARRRLEIQ